MKLGGSTFATDGAGGGNNVDDAFVEGDCVIIVLVVLPRLDLGKCGRCKVKVEFNVEGN